MRPFIFVALCLTAGAQERHLDALNATLWQQHAMEYRAGAIQAWHSAAAALPAALKNKSWTASLEQQRTPVAKWKKLPPALVVDVDETVLDNSPGQGRFIAAGPGRYSPELWRAWTAERKAQAVPGAVEFLRAAGQKGVTVFFITNRGVDEEADTRENLLAQGFAVGPAKADLGDTLLVRGEKAEWTSDKTSRREAVAKHYRIILLGGDDLNDFLPARVSPAERLALAMPHEAWWGRRWIVLPNPMYGSWEDSLLDFDRTLTPTQAAERKIRLLKQ